MIDARERKRVNALFTNINAFLMPMESSYRCPWCHRGMLEKKGFIYHCPECSQKGDVVTLASVAWGIDETDAMYDLEGFIPADAYYEEEPEEEPEAKTELPGEGLELPGEGPGLPEFIDNDVYICDEINQEEAWREAGSDAFSLEQWGLDGVCYILPKLHGTVRVRIYDDAQREALIGKLKEMGVKYEVATDSQMDVWYFMHDIYTDKFKPVPTGLPGLDELLEGGFTAQTIITLGGAPGVGKTSFACSVLENMAVNGHNVVYINLEMSKEQLIARTLSRITYQLTSTGKERPVKLTQKETLMGQKQTKEQREALRKAAIYYWEKVAPHFVFNPHITGPGQSGILRAITREADRAVERGEKPPIVCVDYLQIVDFTDTKNQRYDAVEGMKKFLNDLKLFAIKYNTMVLLIIAHNRTSNSKGAVTQESGRDSSAIEYSGDVMLGLSFTAVEQGQCSLDAIRLAIDGGELLEPEGADKSDKEYKDYLKRKAELEVAKKRKDEITLKLLKGRMGERGRKELIFKGEASMFVEKGDKGETWNYCKGWKPTKETPFDTKK